MYPVPAYFQQFSSSIPQESRPVWLTRHLRRTNNSTAKRIRLQSPNLRHKSLYQTALSSGYWSTLRWPRLTELSHWKCLSGQVSHLTWGTGLCGSVKAKSLRSTVAVVPEKTDSRDAACYQWWDRHHYSSYCEEKFQWELSDSSIMIRCDVQMHLKSHI